MSAELIEALGIIVVALIVGVILWRRAGKVPADPAQQTVEMPKIVPVVEPTDPDPEEEEDTIPFIRLPF